MKTIHSLTIATVLLLSFLLTPTQTLAQSFMGTITSFKGDVKILSRGDRSGSKVLLYEGQTLSYKNARIGQKVKPHQIILTGPNGQAKVVYPNGDHLSIGPGSSLALPSKSGSDAKDGSQLKLYYGKMRALISKKGPRNNLMIKTKSAVAGVRGTDFYFSQSGATGTKLTVLRGAVALAKTKRQDLNLTDSEAASTLQKNKAITVEKGFTAALIDPNEIPPTTEIAPQPAVDLSKGMPDMSEMADKKEKNPSKTSDFVLQAVTKEVLMDVEKVSTIPSEMMVATANVQLQNEIKELQEKSKEAVLNDIKDDDPKLYKTLKENKDVSSADVNSAVVAKMFKEAPREKVQQKISEDELNNMESVYDKYFKND
ncbi:MAG: FecR domain-containing protein [Bdellovibrionales bacterium]|nr:FecR domain-containing protein [Bdellovibrionales bacterium]